MKAGDRVRVKRKAEYTFDAFRGETAEVLDLRQIGGQPWARLHFPALARETWLPCSRLELATEEAKT